MFYGEYKHGIDPKGRIILPSRFREVAKENSIERFFVTRGLDKCVFMFTEHEWHIQEQKFKGNSFTRQQARQFNRMFFSGAAEVLPDKQGRFIIPQYLKDFASIDKETVIIGVSNRIEIWNPQSWTTIYEETSSLFEETAENMLDL